MIKLHLKNVPSKLDIDKLFLIKTGLLQEIIANMSGLWDSGL